MCELTGLDPRSRQQLASPVPSAITAHARQRARGGGRDVLRPPRAEREGQAG
ncbi:Hypothetical protein A7982_11373 [Minicystis rosea]|nr:Hypothetical protein A7982_11373 [Minicystis rosea]